MNFFFSMLSYYLYPGIVIYTVALIANYKSYPKASWSDIGYGLLGIPFWPIVIYGWAEGKNND